MYEKFRHTINTITTAKTVSKNELVVLGDINLNWKTNEHNKREWAIDKVFTNISWSPLGIKRT